MSPDRKARKLGFEPQDIPARGIAWSGVAYIVAVAVLVGLVTVLAATVWNLGSDSEWQNILAGGPVSDPPLLTNPSAEFDAYRRHSLKRLNGYGWIDRQRGIAHIPIEHAMRLEAERAAQ